MRIGILGDTHDHLPNLGAAVAILNREAGGLFLHTGDFISPFVIGILASLNGEVRGVYGNNDGDHLLLQERCREAGNVSIEGYFCEIRAGSLRIALLHGHEKSLLAGLVEGGIFDLVVHGHTHKASVARVRQTLVINPGEACGYLTGTPTCAMYDTDTSEGYILPI